jgi:hypothetical protein
MRPHGDHAAIAVNSGATPSFESRVEPETPYFGWSWPGVVRSFGLSDALEDRLVGWLRAGARVRGDDDEVTIEPEELRGGRIWVSKESLSLDCARRAEKLGLLALFQVDYPEVTPGKDDVLTFSKPMAEGRVRALLAAIEEVAAVVSSPAPRPDA